MFSLQRCCEGEKTIGPQNFGNLENYRKVVSSENARPKMQNLRLKTPLKNGGKLKFRGP